MLGRRSGDPITSRSGLAFFRQSDNLGARIPDRREHPMADLAAFESGNGFIQNLVPRLGIGIQLHRG
jgi:hypothetical protein